MTSQHSKEVIILGGGLAGLTCALHLSQHNYNVLLIEKHKYPHHRVCGEYVSNEVLPYLQKLGIDPKANGAKQITKFEISDSQGKKITSQLPLGGFGLSRYAFDFMLYEKLGNTAEILFNTVESVNYSNNNFTIKTQERQTFTAPIVVGAFGKRSNIDTFLQRSFIQQKSPWLGVKCHYEFEFPDDTVALHNFEGGYCGLSKTETDVVNACYLTTFKSFKKYGRIEDFQKGVMSKNPYLAELFEKGQSVFKNPLSISQISFQKKKPVENHMFMIGDSAGLIHPLCGNGMAMAIHSAKLFSELFIKASEKGSLNRVNLEREYTSLWTKTFSKRLHMGRVIQGMLLHPKATNMGLLVAKAFPSVVPKLIKQTHGKVLQ